jgi:hypothetical protein
MLINREYKIALVIDIAVLLTHNHPITEAEKIIKYENLALEIKNIWKLNNVPVHTLVISRERVVTKNCSKYPENIGLTKHTLRVGQKAALLQPLHIIRKFLGHAP